MYNTEHENGVLICSIHRTPISKSHGRFFCLKCQREENTMTKKKAITKAIDDSSYIGSHRHQIFEQKLNENGYRIAKRQRKQYPCEHKRLTANGFCTSCLRRIN